MTTYNQAVLDYARTSEREDLERSYLTLIQQREDAHNALDLLEPYPPRLTHDGKDYTVQGRLDWWREHRSYYRRVGTLQKMGWNTLTYRQDGSVTLADREPRVVYVEEHVEPDRAELNHDR